MKPTDERFDAKTTVLIENVEHHMDEEEQDWFPKVREARRKQLRDRRGDARRQEEGAEEPSQPSALKKTVDAVMS